MANSVLVLGRRIVDLDAGIVSGAGEPVLLSQREIQLLSLLGQQANAPVSRTQILTQAFGYSERVASRTVDMTVKRLRKKLEDDPSTPEFLLTEYGTGYSLRMAVAAAREPVETGARSPRMATVVDAVRSRPLPVWVRLVPGDDPEALRLGLAEEGFRVLVRPPVETTPRLPQDGVVLAWDTAPFGWSEVTVPPLDREVCRGLLGVEEDPWADALLSGLEGSPCLIELAHGCLRVASTKEVAVRARSHGLVGMARTAWSEAALSQAERLPKPLLAALWSRHRPAPLASFPCESDVLLALARQGWVHCDRGLVALTTPYRHVVQAALSEETKRSAKVALGHHLEHEPLAPAFSREELSEYLMAIEHHPQPAVLWPRLWALLETCAHLSERAEFLERALKAKTVPTAFLPQVLLSTAWDQRDHKMDAARVHRAHKLAVALHDTAFAGRVAAVRAAQQCDDGDIPGGIAAIREVLAACTEPVERARVCGVLAYRLHYHGVDPHESAELARAGLAELVASTHITLRLDLMTTLGGALLRISDRAAEAVYEDALQLATETGRIQHARIVAAGLGWSLLSREDARALELFRASAAQTLDDLPMWIQLILGVGWAQLSLGYDVRAAASFRQVRHAAVRAGDARSQVLGHLFEGIVEFLNARDERGETSWALGAALSSGVMEDYEASCAIARALFAGTREPEVHWQKIVAARVRRSQA